MEFFRMFDATTTAITVPTIVLYSLFFAAALKRRYPLWPSKEFAELSKAPPRLYSARVQLARTLRVLNGTSNSDIPLWVRQIPRQLAVQGVVFVSALTAANLLYLGILSSRIFVVPIDPAHVVLTSLVPHVSLAN